MNVNEFKDDPSVEYPLWNPGGPEKKPKVPVPHTQATCSSKSDLVDELVRRVDARERRRADCDVA